MLQADGRARVSNERTCRPRVRDRAELHRHRIKDDLGEISYVSGVSLAASIGASVRKIGDLERMLELHGSGVYPIARQVFKDPHLAAAALIAICDSSGKPWRDGRGMTWTDPRKREVWQ